MSYEVFENIDYENLNSLFILANNDFRNISDIKLNYSKEYNFLQENLNFLIEIEIFNVGNNQISLKEKSDNFKELLLKKILKKNVFFLLIKEYFQNFKKDDQGRFSFKPDMNYNLITSDLRNFLISLNIIKYENENYFILDPNILDRFKTKKISPFELKKILDNQAEVGLAAEKLVFQKETLRVQKINKDLKVKHVSLEDVTAGYDILSYNENQENIYIEVKAVSSSNFKFYLSSNEFNKANLMNKDYFLYLLPRDLSSSNNFDYEKILKINEIKKNIFDNTKNWQINNDNFLIFKKT
jgi:hypothetical protein